MKFYLAAKYLGVATLALGIAVGCASTDDKSMQMGGTQDKAAVESSILEAKNLFKAAKDGGYAWRDTGKIIESAEKAVAEGDLAKASTLAKKAADQSILAKQQSAAREIAIDKLFGPSQLTSKASAEKAIAAAKTLLKEAKEGGYAWRDTGKIIEKAEKALGAGDYSSALKLAIKASDQSELAKQQKESQDLYIKERFGSLQQDIENYAVS